MGKSLEQLNIINEIKKLKIEKNAVIVAHSYQRDEVQEVADMVGDSFALSKYCANTEAEVVVFCGVHFMAESAKILSPEKIVLLPEIDAGCPMADMITGEDLKKFKAEYPDAAVVCYINSTAEVKAESDVSCTSSNAVNIVRNMKEKKLLFVPDKNLGRYVAQQVPEKEIICWEGYCITHYRITEQEVLKVKELHPEAKLLIHPECRPEVVALADFIGSTKQIIDFARNSNDNKFIIGTEMGVLYQLKKENPNKTFYMMSNGLVCPNMKKTTLNSVFTALSEMKYRIEIDEQIRLKAKGCLERMLQIG
jgi:quinolinate synthase